MLQKYKTNFFPSAYMAIEKFNHCSCDDIENKEDCLSLKKENSNLLHEVSQVNIIDSNSNNFKLNYFKIDFKDYFVYKSLEEIETICEKEKENSSSNVNKKHEKKFIIDDTIIKKKFEENLYTYTNILKNICNIGASIRFKKNEMTAIKTERVKKMNSVFITTFKNYLEELCPLYLNLKEKVKMILETCADSYCEEHVKISQDS